jgi:crotonobetainyl-CoA:carnitine CoA-transferase CaiB-like acyl-CoA transferase
VSPPLDGLLVVDLTRALAGPHATMMLGDLGARVVKVEAPGTGDDTRSWGPPFLHPEGAARESSYFLSANRNKESVALDLKDDADRQVLLALVDAADVLVENFRTGVLERLGLGAQVLLERNPRLVVLSISGFGHDGPEGGRAGYDQIAQGEAGVMSLTGPAPEQPQKVGVPIGDLLAGMYGAYGVLAAVHERHRTGRGQVVRTSLLASLGRCARIPGHPVDRRGGGRPRPGQPPPVDLALRAVPVPRRRGADCARQRGPVAQVLCRLRAGPGRGRARQQSRAGGPP